MNQLKKTTKLKFGQDSIPIVYKCSCSTQILLILYYVFVLFKSAYCLKQRYLVF